jgi:hypothetical protein
MRIIILPPFLAALSLAFAACSSTAAVSDAGPGANSDEQTASERGEDARFTWTPETVLDRTTGLTWQRRVGDMRRTWTEADAVCVALGESWRLPTRDELLTILGGDAEPPAFGGTGDWYWSSTRSENVADAAWVVGIARYTNTHGLETQGLVRCVR